MDASQALRDAENALRDFIFLILSKNNIDWLSHCGVAPERIEKWEERKAAETKRQQTGVIEERIIYYADFYDLKTILKKNWSGEFSAALGDWKKFEVYLGELEKLRDADAHRRELLPHQKHLIIGMSGEIRTRIVRYRSKMETPDDCFPRIESARDNLGNLWIPGSDAARLLKTVDTKMSLRPGDILEFVVTATDPEDLPLQYAVTVSGTALPQWQSDQNLRVVVEESHIGKYLVSKYRSSVPGHTTPEITVMTASVSSIAFFQGSRVSTHNLQRYRAHHSIWPAQNPRIPAN